MGDDRAEGAGTSDPVLPAAVIAFGFARVCFFENRETRRQPMFIRLALPPAAAVLVLTERSRSSNSSG